MQSALGAERLACRLDLLGLGSFGGRMILMAKPVGAALSRVVDAPDARIALMPETEDAESH
jgi:hypothetical protein